MHKKIIVIGCPGSGKSYFSKQLSKRLNIPLYHLDNIYWKKDKTTVTRELLIEHIENIMQRDRWIIDGNYFSTLEPRIKACESAIFLDFETSQCLEGIEERVGIPRDDMPWVEDEVSEELVAMVQAFSEEIRPQILALLERYEEKEIIILKNRMASTKYLKGTVES